VFSKFILQLSSRLITFVAILVLTFFLLHLVPGSPFDTERKLPPEIEKNLYEKYGLHKQENKSFVEWVSLNLVSYGKRLSRLSLGPSLKYVDRDVADVIGQALPVSIVLGGASFLFAVIFSLLLAIIIMRCNSRLLDQAHAFFSSFTISLPVFMLCIILISIFPLSFKLFPPALWEGVSYAVLPVISLGLAPIFFMSELLLGEMKKQQKQYYVLAARARGVKEIFILLKHILKNSINPLLAIMGPIVASLLTGSFIVETIFAIPGLGRHFIGAVIDRDYFLVMGITLVYAAVLILMNWLADGLSKKIDPRIK